MPSKPQPFLLPAEEWERLRRRAQDARRIAASGAPHFTSFLTAGECKALAQRRFHESDVNALFWGGYEGAERCVYGAFPAWHEPETALFPVTPVTATYKSDRALTHRDFLGTLMGLSIRRDAVGDILADTGFAVLFVLGSVAPFLLRELRKVGGAPAEVRPGAPEALPAAHAFEDMTLIVSSLRLDAVVAALCRMSREKSAGLIRAGRVQVWGIPAEDGAAPLKDGDELCVRGFGKVRIAGPGGTTKNKRIVLQLQKFI